MKTLFTYRYQAGLSMIELMIAVLLGSIISLAVVQLYISNSQTFQTNQDIARLQENGRFVLYRLSTELRMSGYMGCIKSDPSKLTVASNLSSDLDTAFKRPVFGTEGSGTNNDEITLSHGVSDNVATISSVSGNTYTAAGVGSLVDAAPNNIVMIADCEKAVALVPSGTTTNTLTVPSTITIPSFNPESEIMKATSTRFFINNVTTGGVTTPFFAQEVNDSGTVENLVDNVEGLQILYGEDTDGTPDSIANSYRRANQVTNWSDVVAVRISVTLRTPIRGTQPVIRQTMDLTVDVRNR